MATFNNGESLSSVRTKINAAIDKIDGNATISNDLTADGLNLAAISDTIDDTAVDIFVYDTSKDSDGGAWRKRTQHTSWYNETLNTSTRGSRKEFPAVAVIVVEAYVVNIYDGDDPDLPLWRYFDIRDYDYYQATNTGIAALNGMIVVSNTGNIHRSNIRQFDFIKDRYLGLRSATYENAHYLAEPLTSTDVINSSGLGGGLVANGYANDVAMTVLPNAPIDAATGLPVPTIAVATDGGVSVIKDDGTVVDIKYTSSTPSDDIAFVGTEYIRFSIGYSSSGNTKYLHLNSIPASDVNDSNGTQKGSSVAFYSTAGGTAGIDLALIPDGGSNINMTLATDSIGTTTGLTLLDEDTTTPANGMVAYTASDYATGWMNGDIKLATLSDTDDTNVTGSELVTNGDFATSSDWTIDGGSTGWSITGGVLQGSSATGNVTQDITTVVGKKYVISFEVSGHSGSGDVYVRPSIEVSTADYVEGDGSYSGSFTATTTTTTLVIRGRPSQPFTGDVDNISVRLAEEDRSVNGNGLQVFGTVTKSAVATGADLVGYSGFSGVNYLKRPYDSNLNFGDTDFCIMGWSKSTDTFATFICNFNSNYGFRFVTTGGAGSGYYAFVTGNGSVQTLSTTANDNLIEDDVWVYHTAVRRNGVLEVWENGRLLDTLVTTNNIDTNNLPTYIGVRQSDFGQNITGQMALWRISATAPSPEQIKKIYEDEKVLFQEGAQATLYGSSDAVTALAYDDSNGILSVGTSAGRSDFQGLRRVNNTTNAVGAAISASNGLIVEE